MVQKWSQDDPNMIPKSSKIDPRMIQTLSKKYPKMIQTSIFRIQVLSENQLVEFALLVSEHHGMLQEAMLRYSHLIPYKCKFDIFHFVFVNSVKVRCFCRG